MRNAGLDEAQAGIKIDGRNVNNLRYADDTTLIAENEEELKSLLMKVKEESEKASLKLNIQRTKIMVSGPITSWQIDGKTVADFNFLGSKKLMSHSVTVETVADFNFLGSKKWMVTAAMKLKDAFSLGKKLKSRDITFPTKFDYSKLWFFQ